MSVANNETTSHHNILQVNPGFLEFFLKIILNTSYESTKAQKWPKITYCASPAKAAARMFSSISFLCLLCSQLPHHSEVKIWERS